MLRPGAWLGNPARIGLTPVQDLPTLAELLAKDQPRGPGSRLLQLGSWSFLLEGLDDELAACLDRRWGGFLGPGTASAPRIRVRVLQGGREGWLEPAKPGEAYRIEAAVEQGRPIVCSYHFALCSDGGSWRVVLTETALEPAERALENAVRYLAARVAVEEGGFALHAAGVLRRGRVHLFAGPSRSGKTTAVSLSRPEAWLGDDFAVLVREKGGQWFAPSVPFDNSEVAPPDPPRGLFPVAGVWRLFQSQEARLEVPKPARAVASLMACVAFPWALAELADPLLEHVRRFVADSRFAHLHFAKSPEFWDLIDWIEGRTGTGSPSARE